MKDIYLCTLYGVFATILNVGSKALNVNFGICPSFTILLVQNLIVSAIGSVRGYRVAWKEFKECWVISIYSIGETLCLGAGMKELSLPLFVAIRKLCAAELFLVDFVGSKQDFNNGSVLAVALISFGAIFAGFHNADSGAYGYIVMFFANLLNILLLLRIRHAKEVIPSLKSFKQMYLSSLVAIPYSIVLFYVFEEHFFIGVSFYSHTWEFWGGVLIVAMLGAGSNLMMFKCTNQVSPLATAVTGNLRDFVSMILGLIIFKETEKSWWFLAGLAISATGAFIYTYENIRKQIDIKKKMIQQNI